MKFSVQLLLIQIEWENWKEQRGGVATGTQNAVNKNQLCLILLLFRNP